MNRIVPILIVCLLLAAPRSASSDTPPKTGLVIELAALARSSDVLRPSELEPDQVPTSGALASVEIPIHASCALVLGATVGGSWQTFEGPGIQGRVSYVEWTIRGGVERAIFSTESARVTAELYSEYGEQNSWVKNLLLSREGPHGVHVGGGVRLGLDGPEWHRIRPRLGVERSVFRAHGTDHETGNGFAWMGGTTALSVGLGVRVSP